jgi:hypothetical protein
VTDLRHDGFTVHKLACPADVGRLERVEVPPVGEALHVRRNERGDFFDGLHVLHPSQYLLRIAGRSSVEAAHAPFLDQRRDLDRLDLRGERVIRRP